MQNNIKTVDRRVMKTKKSIHTAVVNLLTQKDITDITITEIVNLADINRKTFYNYYSNVYQVVDEIENEVIKDISQALENIDLDAAMKEPYIIFKKLTSIIITNIDFYGYLISMNSNVSLATKIASLLKEKTKEVFSCQLGVYDNNLDLILDFIHSGMLSVYQHWFLSNRTQPIEEISKAVSVMCFEGINGMIANYRTDD